MSGRTPSDPGSADAATTSKENVAKARSTDSEIDAAFAAATSEKPPPPPARPPAPRHTLLGIAPPVVSASPLEERRPQTQPSASALEETKQSAVSVEERRPKTETSAAPLVAPAPASSASLAEGERPQIRPTRSSKTASFEVPRPVQAFDQEELPSPESDAALTLRRGPAPDVAPTGSSEKPYHRRRRSPTVGRVMNVRVRIAGGAAPLWTVIAALVVPLVVLAALLAAAVSSRHRPAPPAATVVSAATTTASAASEPLSSAVAPEISTNQLGLSELEGRSPETLTSDQVLARAAGRREREVSVARGLRQSIEREPDSIKQKSMLLALRKLTTNPVTAAEALGAMATLPGSLGPDLLYEVWIAGPTRPEGELARELLYSSDIRPKASDALAVPLDLRAATSCEQAKAALSRALKAGDRRALSPINKLTSKRGCGPDKKEDCYACLREGEQIKDAAKAAKKRKAPATFTVR